MYTKRQGVTLTRARTVLSKKKLADILIALDNFVSFKIVKVSREKVGKAHQIAVRARQASANACIVLPEAQ